MLTRLPNHANTRSYWDSHDGSTIRIIDGAADEITGVDIMADGRYFVSCSADGLVKVWDYDQGICVAMGEGHSDAIKDVKFSPDGQSIVTVGAEGAIFTWTLPAHLMEGGETEGKGGY